METKVCTKCQQEKSLDAYGPRRKGLNTWCRICRAEYNREYRKINPGVEKFVRIKYLYNLSKEQYELLLSSQDNKCAICSTDKPDNNGSFNVDHDHATGKVRGILCAQCNFMLGHAKDNIKLLQNAIAYLERHKA